MTFLSSCSIWARLRYRQRNPTEIIPLSIYNMTQAVILDQDGVLIRELDHPILGPDDVHLLEGVAEAVALLNDAGYRVAVCSNQDDLCDVENADARLDAIERKLRDELSQHGASLDLVLYCADGRHTHSRRHKPGPGMLEEAMKTLGAVAAETPVIGDQLSDLEAALKAGCPRILVLTGHGTETERDLPDAVRPVAIHKDLLEAVKAILQGEMVGTSGIEPLTPAV
jgi:D-glycero-D-manno-heptose 1,7-bisphosphate phosphatase